MHNITLHSTLPTAYCLLPIAYCLLPRSPATSDYHERGTDRSPLHLPQQTFVAEGYADPVARERSVLDTKARLHTRFSSKSAFAATLRRATTG